jgi:hypothetical protein
MCYGRGKLDIFQFMNRTSDNALNQQNLHTTTYTFILHIIIIIIIIIIPF